MTNEELTLQIQAGENRYYEELWDGVKGFVITQASAYRRYFPDSTIDLDDLAQGGYLALVDAVRGFDPQAGGTFLTVLSYHLRKVWRDMYGLRGKRDALNDCISLDEPLSDDGDTTRLDLLPDDRAELAFEESEDQIFREQLRAFLDKALDAAPHGDVIRRRYFQGQTGKAIAAELGVSVSRVGQYEQEARRYLRHGPFTRELRSFDLYHGNGLKAWKESGTSLPEKILLEKERLEEYAER